jgi:hypothetical protein
MNEAATAARPSAWTKEVAPLKLGSRSATGSWPIAPRRHLYLVEEEADPLGLLAVAELPLGPLLAVDPDVPPAPELLVPPVPPLAPGLEGEADPDAPGVVAVVDEDDDEPPGITTVSFSLVVVDAEGVPPGTTVVVSLRSHAESARAPTNSNR